MKSGDRKKIKKPKNRKKPSVKPKKEKVLIVAQEFKFAKLLSGNEKTTRDRVLKTLKRWLLNCFSKNYVFKEGDFIRVWKGLFYAVWMSDKPLVQEDLCESISHILDLFPNEQFKYALMMTRVGFKVLAMEWYGLDQHRMDKFLMLVRRYLRGSFRCLLRQDWAVDACQAYGNMLSSEDGILAVKTPFYARNGVSLIFHITECYLEELSKVSKGKIPDESLLELLDPFLKQVCVGEDSGVCVSSRRLLNDLLKQSELGLQYAGATNAWKEMGCPPEGPDAFELVSDEETEDAATENDNTDSGPLDPRAGRVNVVLEPLPVPAQLIAERIRTHMSKSTSKAYKRADMCLKRFEKLLNNDYPLKIKVQEPEAKPQRGSGTKAAVSLIALEKSLVQSSDELALRGLSRKHRKRLLAKSRSGLSIVEDAELNESNKDIEADSNDEEDKAQNRKRKVKGSAKIAKKPKLDKAEKENNTNEKRKSLNKKQEVKLCDKPKVETAKRNKVLVNKESKVNMNIKIKTKASINGVAGPKVDLATKTDTALTKCDKKETTIKQINSQNQKDTVNSKNKTKASIGAPAEPKVDKKGLAQKQTNSRNHENNNKNKNQPNGKTKGFTKPANEKKVNLDSPKKVKFVLKNNCKQGTVDYYKSVRQSPDIPFDSNKKPDKANLKPGTPSPINPFFKKKLRLRR
ncbi:unnamed protein product [Leptosia nina]|uniref:Ribosomal RNA processing protein 1 homolog n=1 Tax=Leptosia nina TaxID=320188 RepID=A0AAV1JAL5_9NEOP